MDRRTFFSGHFFVAILVFALMIIPASAQVGDIQEEARRNDQQSNSHTTTQQDDHENNHEHEHTPHGDGCLDACCSIGAHTSFLLLNEYHQQLLYKEDTLDRVSSVEIFFRGGYNPGYYLLAPRIRGNWGLVSTDFRYTNLLESSFGRLNTYATYDWQILVMNLVIIPSFHLRLGGGLLFEQVTGNAFGEFTLGGDVYFNRDYRINAEVRYAPPRTETNATLNYRLKQIDRLSTYVSIGGQYAEYYREVKTWTIFGGFLIMLE